MKYQFPIIKHISQVLAAILDRPEFVVSVKEGGYTIIQYSVAHPGLFPPIYEKQMEDMGSFSEAVGELLQHQTNMAILRECRGLVFNTASGNLISRRYHKFFNVGERPETTISAIDFSQPHVLMTKLDGSMVTPIMTDNGLRWGTKRGITDTSLQVEKFVESHPAYQKLAADATSREVTPIFEWCSRKQRIVLDYAEDQLVLTAIRNNENGVYWPREATVHMGEKFRVPVVAEFDCSAKSLTQLVETISALEGAEGVVIAFDDGHRVKIKGEWYVKLHRTKDGIRLEKDVIALILNNGLDDLIPFLDESDTKRVTEFADAFWRGVFITRDSLQQLYDSYKAIDQKDFAVNFAKKQDPKVMTYLFAMRQGRDLLEELIETLRTGCSSSTSIEKNRWIHTNYYH